MPDAFVKLWENERVMELMARIELNITEREDREGPCTYRCGTCQDKGVLLVYEKSHMDDTVAVGPPCRDCTLGAGIVRQRSRDRFQGQRMTAAANRRLTDVERELMSVGDYSFLDAEQT